MGRNRRKYFMLLFKLFLLIQLYSYYKVVEVNAVGHKDLETCKERHPQNGTYFEDETEKNLPRTKRPARMIPAQYLVKKEKNRSENQNIVDTRFYGPASSCVEISKLGYTLNGYYLVKGKNQTKNNQVEVLGCRFKHPNGTKEAKEERIGFIDIERIKSTKSVKRRSQEPSIDKSLEAIEDIDDRPKRPARLLPLRMTLGEPKNNTEDSRFYGPAASCEELGKLGYTLNGIYLVDCKDKSKKRKKIEVIECRFKQPIGSKEAKEERLGFVNIEAKKAKEGQRRYGNASIATRSVENGSNQRIVQRPARLLPLQLLNGKDNNDTQENQVAFIERFYGPPNSCSDLKKLGYTLNGYYLVNGASRKSTTKRPVKDPLKTPKKGSIQTLLPYSRITSNTELNGAGSSHQIEIYLCKFRQPIGATESFKEERFVLSPKATLPTYNQNMGIKEEQLVLGPKESKKFKFLPLDHGGSESYPLMNLESEKCLDSDDKLTLVIEKDCNPSTAKRWKLMKDGTKQLICDVSTAYITKCIFRPIRSGGLTPALTLLPVMGFKTHVSVVKNQIRFLSKTTQMDATERLPCATVTNTPDPALPTTVTVQDCNDNYQNQTWSFVSFK